MTTDGQTTVASSGTPRPQAAKRPDNGVAQFIRARLTWGWMYRATSYLSSALWVTPIVAIVLIYLLAPLMRWLDSYLDWNVTGLGVSGASAMYQTVITLALSFLVFTFGSLLVAIQVAGGQLTSRVIATTLLRDNVVRVSVGLFVFTLLLAVTGLNRLGTTVPNLVTTLTGVLGVACLMAFLFLIDYAARLLRPVSILARVGNQGVEVLRSVYPSLANAEHDESTHTAVELPAPAREVMHTGRAKTLLAVDLASLIKEAQRYDSVIELVPQIGDFIAQDEPLFRLYASAVAIDDHRLRAAVAFGDERTMEQDPVFALRIMVDIALKALSPAINDPTTAVLAIDQIHRLLRVAGKRRLHSDAVVDASGRVRLVQRTPDWDDFVLVACAEIRACGANSLQIARRLRAMIDNLLALLPAYRHAPLLQEKQRLDAAVEAAFTRPDELALARTPDVQGLGGSAARSHR
ncbi:MAG: DUF2254 domain-containing protein [Candidatus Binatia bacterium]